MKSPSITLPPLPSLCLSGGVERRDGFDETQAIMRKALA